MTDGNCKTRKRKIIILLVAVLGVVVFAAGGIFAYQVNQNRKSSREKARQLHCLGQLKQIGIGLRLYADTYDERFPKKLHVLVKNQDMTEDFLQCPSVSDKAIDYKYVAGGKKLDKLGSDTVVAFDKQGNHNGYINVLFANGRAEGFEVESIEELLEEHEEFRLPDRDE